MASPKTGCSVSATFTLGVGATGGSIPPSPNEVRDGAPQLLAGRGEEKGAVMPSEARQTSRGREHRRRRGLVTDSPQPDKNLAFNGAFLFKV